MKPIYFDYNATTPVHELVLQEMLPYFTERFGNPGCGHLHGLEAARSVDQARSRLAGLINAEAEQIYFFSGATEANNLVLAGTLKPGDELIISAVEHPSITQPALELQKKGVILKIAPVDNSGLVNPDQVMDLVSSRTRLVSIMLANNETGTIEPVVALSSILKDRNILIHTDAAQAVGKIQVDVNTLGVD
ncbi:MAG: cysteine desulfurase family protein, partial [Desulfonatronovibrio sp.]